VNQCQPTGNADFVRLIPCPTVYFALAVIEKVASITKAWESCCAHFDKLDAMSLSLENLMQGQMICLVMIVVKAFNKRVVSQNSCITWQWLY